MTDHDLEQAKAEFEQMTATFNLLLGAAQGDLPTPIEREIGFTGTEAEARGSARHIAEEIENDGYTVEFDYLEQSEGVTGRERHLFRYTVTQD